MKAVTCLTKDREALLTCYDFPVGPWDHLRTGNPIESVSATVRHRAVWRGLIRPRHPKSGIARASKKQPRFFATILGGLVTLIGMPPNIVIASFREDALGEPFVMFDFAPVGLLFAAAGLAFIALIAWRLVPQSNGASNPAERPLPGSTNSSRN